MGVSDVTNVEPRKEWSTNKMERSLIRQGALCCWCVILKEVCSPTNKVILLRLSIDYFTEPAQISITRKIDHRRVPEGFVSE